MKRWEKPEITEPRITVYGAGVLGIEPGLMIEHRLSGLRQLQGPFKLRKCDLPAPGIGQSREEEL